MPTTQITPRQVQRLACLYIRQSTVQQVVTNIESTARQYALRERALALGWPAERSSSSTATRVSQGPRPPTAPASSGWSPKSAWAMSGIVLGLEVSRLARNSSDWHRLLEICALTGTLILDEDGLYDPATSTTGCCSA